MEENWIKGPIIGRGSTATVSLAITKSGEFLAVKSTEFSSSDFLQREQSILSKLNSPYIVKYIDSALTTENDKLVYNLLMEYVSGGSIHDLIKKSGGKLPEPAIRSYTKQILKGLMYLHEQGIVHCDLKSQNVMIGGENGVGLAKIVDLGCAKIVDGGVTVEFSGTPAFMSPEVARGEEQRFPADVWALGCTVIEMATGLNPWPELNDVVAAMYKIGFTNESPEIPVWLSEKGKDFLRNCLRKDPKQRWVVEELLQHPFLEDDEEEEDQIPFRNCLKSVSSSPNTVLDQGFWDSCETSKSRSIEVNYGNSRFWGSNSSPIDRIKKLAGDGYSGEPDWKTAEEDDEGWIEVRGNKIGDLEKRNEEEEEENCVEATSSSSSEEIENRILDQEDSLFFQYSTQDNFNYFYYNLFLEGDIILYYYYDYLYDHIVSENIIFRHNNNKNHFFSPHFTTSCLFVFIVQIHNKIITHNHRFNTTV